MEIDIAGMKATLSAKTLTVKISSPGYENHWIKQGVEVVLLFGILAALQRPLVVLNPPEKSK